MQEERSGWRDKDLVPFLKICGVQGIDDDFDPSLSQFHRALGPTIYAYDIDSMTLNEAGKNNKTIAIFEYKEKNLKEIKVTKSFVKEAEEKYNHQIDYLKQTAEKLEVALYLCFYNQEKTLFVLVPKNEKALRLLKNKYSGENDFRFGVGMKGAEKFGDYQYFLRGEKMPMQIKKVLTDRNKIAMDSKIDREEKMNLLFEFDKKAVKDQANGLAKFNE